MLGNLLDRLALNLEQFVFAGVVPAEGPAEDSLEREEMPCLVIFLEQVFAETAVLGCLVYEFNVINRDIQLSAQLTCNCKSAASELSSYIYNYVFHRLLEFTSQYRGIIPVIKFAKFPEQSSQKDSRHDKGQKVRNRKTHPYTLASEFQRKEIQKRKEDENLS